MGVWVYGSMGVKTHTATHPHTHTPTHPHCPMRLPVEWIRAYAPVEGSTEEIAERLTMAGLEVEETAASESGDVLDIKVTPNRGDCLSVIGVARELAASNRITLAASPEAESADSG